MMTKEKDHRRSAVIDIGSNSIKLIVGEESNGNVKILESLKNIIPIGRDTFFKGRISQEEINQTVGILNKYKEILAQYDIAHPYVIATTAVREASNRNVFIDTIARKTGFTADVFNPGDIVYYIDAYLSHRLKGTYPIHEKNLLIAELGSGSLDISLMENGFILANLGLPIGTLRIKQLMGKLAGSLVETNDAVREYIDNEFLYLRRIIPKIRIDDIILIDENLSFYLQNVVPNKDRKENFFKFSIEEARQMSQELLDNSPEGISKEFKIPLEAADAMAGYAMILNTFFRLTENSTHIYILQALLSEAILTDILLDYELSKKYDKTNQLISIANFICREYNVDIIHAKQVAFLSESIFQHTKDILGLKKSDLLYLKLAAYLHDIGMFVYNRAHHKHSEYIINSLGLFRLTEEEIKIIACIARYHRKAPPSNNHILYMSLSHDKQILVQKLSAILRIANSLDRSHKQKVKKMDMKFGKGQDIIMTAYIDGSFLLEKTDFMEKKAIFEEMTGSTVTLKTQPV